MADDPEYWTSDSTVGDFSYEEFLNQYSLNGTVDMSSVDLNNGFDFSSFSLTDWLEQYNLTEKFNYWLHFLGNNADPYNTDDFVLYDYIHRDHGFELGDYLDAFPLDVFVEELNIS